MTTMPVFDCYRCGGKNSLRSNGYHHRYYVGCVMPDGREINMPYTIYDYLCIQCGHKIEMEYDGERLVTADTGGA